MTVHANVSKNIRTVQQAPQESVVIDVEDDPREISMIQVVNQDSNPSVLYELQKEDKEDVEVGAYIMDVEEEGKEPDELRIEAVAVDEEDSKEHYKIEEVIGDEKE